MTLAYILIFIICVLLVIVVLVQNSKGGGLAANFTGSQVMGVRKTADFLEKATWTLAGTLLFICIMVNIFIPRNTEAQQNSILQDEVKTAVDPSQPLKVPSAAPVNETAKPAEENPVK